MTTSRINAYRWPARLVSHKPFAAERYFITSSSIWQVFFAENYDFSFLFSLFCQQPHFLCKMHNLSAFCRWKTPPLPFAHQYGQERQGLYLLYRRYPFRLLTAFAATFPKGTAFVVAASFPALPKGVPLGELASVARLRGLLPAEPPLPQEAGAANAVFLHDPTREKANRENPQIFPIGKFPIGKFKIILP